MADVKRPPRALTIAGSDSGGGAGIQADLKTFAALGVYGMSAITAITAQNTKDVTAVHEVPPQIVVAQIEAVVGDIGVDAVKTGMLSSRPIIDSVADAIRRLRLTTLVVDPVMVSKSGARLLREDAVEALVKRIIPLATVVTPNVPEAEAITGMTIDTPQDARQAAARIVALGAKAAVVKGGHMSGEPDDIYYDGVNYREFRGARIESKNTHGTGCTFASAIAAGLARGLAIEDAVGQAKRYVTGAIRAAKPLGGGHGPLDHFWLVEDAIRDEIQEKLVHRERGEG